MSPPSMEEQKQALIERSSLARMHLRAEMRALRAKVTDMTTIQPMPAARVAMGVVLTLAGATRGARLLAGVQRGLVVAKVSFALFKFIASRVRKRTDGAAPRPHHPSSTGEFQ